MKQNNDTLKYWESIWAIATYCKADRGAANRITLLHCQSRGMGDGERINRVLRTHGGIENALHWVLDVQVGEGGGCPMLRAEAKGLQQKTSP